ncbi:MAG TPA: DUF805 domain-containing protein [Acidimicrobiales bacterium]|nr:DUF805 domain-containing protein [Acidimicrobiales bacterium]
MGFTEAISSCFAKSLDWEGRARPAEYWWFGLLGVILYGVSLLLFLASRTAGTVADIILVVVLILPGISVSIRRLHDWDQIGAWYLLHLIPIVGTIALTIMMLHPSDSGPNRFGLPYGMSSAPADTFVREYQPYNGGPNWCSDQSCYMYSLSVDNERCMACNSPTVARSPSQN